MNMIVGAALTGTAIPAVAAEPIDPIFATIEAHRVAAAAAEAVQRRYSAFEDELQANERLQRDRRLEGETRRGEEIEAALKQAWHVEQCAAYDLLNVNPTTMAGVVALLTYSEEHDDANHGMGWPDDIPCEELKDCRTWQYFLINNLIEVLPKLMRGVGVMDRNEIDAAIHEISMMVEVLLDAVVTLQVPETDRGVFEVSRKEGEMISFAAFDIDRRITALRDGLDRPTATIVRIETAA